MNISVEEEISLLLRDTGLTLATAESATGGLIAGLITNVSGSSRYYKGSVVSYASEIKEKVLGVKIDSLRQYGAVSRQVAAEMAQGVRQLMHTDIGIADTGIAGPTGGTLQKPVGLFYIALASGDDVIVEEHIFRGNRIVVRQEAAQAALILLRNYLLRTRKTCE